MQMAVGHHHGCTHRQGCACAVGGTVARDAGRASGHVTGRTKSQLRRHRRQQGEREATRWFGLHFD
jgi:hypothetical protein